MRPVQRASGRLARQRLLAGTVFATAVLMLTSCGPGTKGPLVSPHLGSGNRPVTSGSPSPAPSSSPSWERSYPAKQVALGSASLSLRQLWQETGVSIIPGIGLFSHLPAPAASNYDASLSQSQFAALVAANTRTIALEQWAMANDQSAFLPLLEPLSQVPGIVTQDMEASPPVPVNAPNCIMFPTQVSAYAMTSTARAFLQANNPSVSAQDNIVLEETFTAPSSGECTFTVPANGASTIAGSFTRSYVALEAGQYQDSPPVGPIFFSDASGPCSGSGAPVAMCQRQG